MEVDPNTDTFAPHRVPSRSPGSIGVPSAPFAPLGGLPNPDQQPEIADHEPARAPITSDADIFALLNESYAIRGEIGVAEAITRWLREVGDAECSPPPTAAAPASLPPSFSVWLAMRGLRWGDLQRSLRMLEKQRRVMTIVRYINTGAAGATLAKLMCPVDRWVMRQTCKTWAALLGKRAWVDEERQEISTIRLMVQRVNEGSEVMGELRDWLRYSTPYVTDRQREEWNQERERLITHLAQHIGDRSSVLTALGVSDDMVLRVREKCWRERMSTAPPVDLVPTEQPVVSVDENFRLHRESILMAMNPTPVAASLQPTVVPNQQLRCPQPTVTRDWQEYLTRSRGRW